MTKESYYLVIDLIGEALNSFTATKYHLEHQLSLRSQYRIAEIDEVEAEATVENLNREINKLTKARQELIQDEGNNLLPDKSST